MEDDEVEILGSDRRRDGRGRVTIDRAERQRLLELYDRSGQKQQDFASEQGINYNTLVSWLYQRRKGKAGPQESLRGEKIRLHELRLPGAGGKSAAALIIRLPDGVVFEVGDAGGLELAIKALRWLRGA